ncbi:MAG: hypothetical protein DUD39_01495 [Coriobacteriaceae bacterium]|nr:MAG: hypothetical protein DUD39_01495 [Coriobacteriaceae bacterium]
MALLLTASLGRSMRSLPATCSEDQCLSQVREAPRERGVGSSSALSRLQANLLVLALDCAVEAL